MNYEPQEGVDYLIDLYQVAGVSQDADAHAVRGAINSMLKEYHPDRLDGLAPEFRSKGERMSILLNRAKTILLDTEKREVYDQILATWELPISNDGTPIVRIKDMIRAEAAGKSSEELEVGFTKQSIEVAAMVKHNPNQQALLAKLYEAASGEDANDLRGVYDAALFAEDQVLAIEEAERGQLLGLKANDRYETSLGYAGDMQRMIEEVRQEQEQDYQRRALGGVGAQLALLAGETPAEYGGTILPTGSALPHYFDEQVKKVSEIAMKREEILEKRLEIFEPDYPIAEMQSETKPRFVVGIESEGGRPTLWLGFCFDTDGPSLDNIELDSDIEQKLHDEHYGVVYGSGFNILIISPKDQIELKTLLDEACNKYIAKYYPDFE
jgi:curved DNA-binding protein CbpA